MDEMTLDRASILRRRAMVVAHDVAIAVASVPAAVLLRHGTLAADPATTAFLLWGTPLFAAVFLTAMLLFRLHLGLWRYTSTAELASVGKATTISIVAFYAAWLALRGGAGVPLSLPVIQWLVLVFALAGGRIGYRIMRAQGAGISLPVVGAEPPGVAERHVHVLLVGACNAGSAFIRSVHHSRHHPYHVVGVIDISGGHTGRLLHDVPVLGSLAEFDDVVTMLAQRGLKPVRVVLAEQLDPEAAAALLERCNRLGMVLCRIPAPGEFRTTEDGGLDLQPVDLQDLLGRPQAVLDQEAIDRLIVGRRVLVTGAGGSIGAELVRQIACRDPAELTLVDHGEFNLYTIDHEIAERHPALNRRALLCDVRSRARVTDIFTRHRPEIVFHAAALKHVPMVELNPCEGVLTNAIGTRNVADAAATAGALAFVQISTDKAVNPTNVMGATKRLAEFYVQALDLQSAAGTTSDTRQTRFMTVRFGNVLGSSGSVIPLFQHQLAKGGPLTVTHRDIERYFMTIPEAVALVLHASAHGVEGLDERGRICVLDMGQPVKIIDIARQMIRLAGYTPGKDVEITITGLRPGEKLHEELFDDAETRSSTVIDRVMMASPRALPLHELKATFAELQHYGEAGDERAVREIIARVVPGYHNTASVAS